jgi:hypothetical protein
MFCPGIIGDKCNIYNTKKWYIPSEYKNLENKKS